ncbi:FAR1-related protein, partial [Trifolium medium]|nr:FAR1-related protein [Trifolium medium]
MWLPCACSLAKTVNEGKAISMNDIHSHWKRLKFDAAHLCKEENADLSLLPEMEALQEMFKSADHDMKVHLKERLRQFVYPETTMMCPPPSQVKTK